jgi:hypothetical protein
MTPIKDDMKRSSEDEKRDTVAGGVGGIGGMAAGAGAGLTLGPVGAVLGALAGAAGGWWAGKQTIETLGGFENDEDVYYRRLHQQFAADARAYDEVRHAYQIGHLAGRNPDYMGSDFDSVEQDLRRAWDEAHGKAEAWDTVRPYVDRGFAHGRQNDSDR